MNRRRNRLPVDVTAPHPETVRRPRPAALALAYRLCPVCGRAVPLNTPERYCINDGAWMLDRCRRCGAGIGSPYARYCPHCGLALRTDDKE